MRLLLWLGSASVAAGAALFAVCLTRLFAVLFPANGVFLLVGFAACGAVVGGLVAHRLCWLPSRAPGVTAAAAALAGGLVAGTTAFLIGSAGSASTLSYEAIAFLGFAAAGAALAAPYAALPRDAGGVFTAQAVGGGLAMAGAPALLDALAPPPATLLAGLLCVVGGLCALVAAVANRRAREETVADVDDGETSIGRVVGWVVAALAGLAGIGAVAALGLQLTSGWLRLDPAAVSSPKALYASIHDSTLREKVVHSEWDSVGRVDVTEPSTTTDAKWAYLDGGIAGLMYRASGAGTASATQQDIANVPFRLPGARDKVLVIGAGAGEEVLLALAAGAKEVVATESSPALLRAMRRFGDFTGDWTTNPAVRIVELDGRTFLRGSTEQFDVIYVTPASNGAVEPSGAVAGSYLYTIDAVADYLDHLRQDGRLVLKLRDEQEFSRAFNTTFQALTRRGAAPLQAIRRLLAINNQPVADRNDSGIVLPLLLVRKTPFLEDEAKAAYQVLQQTPFTPIFMPFLEQMSPFGGWAVDEYGPAFFEARAPYDIRPVSDTSPFFFETERGFPWSALFVPIVVCVLAGITSWLTRRPSAEALESLADAPEDVQVFLEDDVPWRYAGFVAIAAAGFACGYVALGFRLPLLLGSPRLDVAVGYGAFLLAAAIGSVLAARVPPAALRPAIGWAGLAAGIIGVATIELLPMAAGSLRGAIPETRVAVASAFLVPLGLCFGVPFPSVVRLLAANRRGGWGPFLWAMSALAGGCGAFLALILGIALSFNYAMAIGAALLFGAFMMAGLRYLPFETASEQTPPSAPTDHTAFQRPAETSA